MAFGQASGPPATGKQMRDLEELLQAAGHVDFRDARGPMGFTQRQAGGKFTRDEAESFIEQLQAEVHGDGPPGNVVETSSTSMARPKAPKPTPRNTKKSSGRDDHVDLASIPSERLAAELQARGWAVLEP